MTDIGALLARLEGGSDYNGMDAPICGEAATAIRQLQDKLRQQRFDAQGEPGHALRVEVESLRAKLEKAKEYVRHKAGCAMYTPVDASTDCDCGLSEWVNSL